jgi:very-short-patch-repair endonuclease
MNKKPFSQYKDTPRYITALARANRLQPTLQEEKLWAELSGRKLGGHKFRRQFPIGRYIVDFYNHQNRLVVEIDGKIHENQKEYDANRNSWIAASGYTIVRITNDEVDTTMSAVIAKIKNHLSVLPRES